MGAVAQTPQYSISTVAGGSPPITPAIATEMSIAPKVVATDFAGNVYFVSYNCIFNLDRKGGGPGGIVTRVAGNSRAGYSGDGGPALDAGLLSPTALTADASGSLLAHYSLGE